MTFGEKYLQFPDLFPARQSGEVWGDGAVCLDIPGGPYLIEGLSPPQMTAVHSRLGPLCMEAADLTNSDSPIRIRIFRAASSDFLEFDLRGWHYTIDLDYQESHVRLASLHWMARIEWNETLSGGLWTCEESAQQFGQALENFLRPVVAYRLNELQGALLHSAGVVHQGGAYLFLGPSEAGKTTISRLSLEEGYEILSDDLNGISNQGGSLRVDKLPFAGELAHNATPSRSYPLKGIFRLQHGSAHRVEPMSPAEGTAALISCAPTINGDPLRLDAITRTLERVNDRFPLRRLIFAPNSGFWPLISR